VAWLNAAESGCRMSKGCNSRRLPVQAQPRKNTGKRRPYASFHPQTFNATLVHATLLKPA